MARTDLIEERVTKLTNDFGRYVRVYDEEVSFTTEQLAAHRRCIALRKQAGTVRAAINDSSSCRPSAEHSVHGGSASGHRG